MWVILAWVTLFLKGMIRMIKKVEKEIQKLEQQKAMKIGKKTQLENEITSNLKDLYNLKNQYEKLLQTTDQTLGKITEHK